MGDEEDPVAQAKAIVGPKVALVVLTSTTACPDESPTGFWLTELTHPLFRWKSAGWAVEFCSITGTAVPDPNSLEGADTESLDWLESNKEMLAALPTLETLAAAEELPYDVLYFCGGMGAAFDFPENESVKTIAKTMFEAGKVVSACCHGPAALINVDLSDGTKLLAGKECTGFSNEEEEKMGKSAVIAKGSGPGSCEDMMGKAVVEGEEGGVEGAAGGLFTCKPAFEPCVCTAEKLITGQNPASAAPMAETVLYSLDPIRAKYEPLRKELLVERSQLASEIETKKEEFTIAMGACRGSDDEATVSKVEKLQMLSQVTRDWLMSRLSTVDAKLERLSVARQIEVDKWTKILADAAAAEAAEE